MGSAFRRIRVAGHVGSRHRAELAVGSAFRRIRVEPPDQPPPRLRRSAEALRAKAKAVAGLPVACHRTLIASWPSRTPCASSMRSTP